LFGFLGLGAQAGDDAGTDKRLSRAVELFKLEGGLASAGGASAAADSPEAMNRLSAQELKKMRDELQKRVSESEGDDAGAGAAKTYVIKKGVLANSLDDLLRQPGSALDDGYRLVWRAPQYLVPDDFSVVAQDVIGALEKVLEAYNREGISLQALLFSGNKVIEVSLGGYRPRAGSAKASAVNP
jgi:hypothetical protein